MVVSHKPNKTYVRVNEALYASNTPPRLVKLLERLRRSGRRVRIFYGDRETGLDVLKDKNTIGIISTTSSSEGRLILKYRKNSLKGIELQEDQIVKITLDGNPVFVHPNYHQPMFNVYDSYAQESSKHSSFVVETLYNGVIETRTTKNTRKEAENYVDFLKGIRNKP